MRFEQRMKLSTVSEIKSLSDYLEVQRKHYDSCIEALDHNLDIDGVDANLRFKHLKFDSNSQPKFETIAKILANYLIYYSSSIRNWDRKKKDAYETSNFYNECRDLLRKCSVSGEAGEILLYFLLETVLRAPQMVAKLELKQNPNFESLGSDGIHVKWNSKDELLDVYFGEAKLYGSVYGALDELFKSVKKFHDDNMVEHELKLVTRHYKWADGPLKDAVLRFINPQEPGGDCRINHACLVGYDWEKYNEFMTIPDGIIKRFKVAYREDTVRLRSLLQSRFDNFQYKHFRYEVFFLPFKSVQEFRNRFQKAVGISL